ncbi:MAG: NAD(P)/FAD-dependent oxidoreductase [Thermoplasmatota archaeon]
MAERVDVLIIGGGPAGCAAAIALRERAPDLAVVVLEARDDRGREPRPLRSGEVLFAMHRRAIASLGIEVEKAPFITHEITRFRVVTVDGREYRTELDWAHRLSEVERAAFDAALRERAARAGADVRTGMRATELVLDGVRVASVRARLASGAELEFEPRWLIDAGGRFAPTARQLGLKDTPKDDNHAVVAGFVRDFPGDPELWEAFFFEPLPTAVEMSHPRPGLARIGLGVTMKLLNESKFGADATTATSPTDDQAALAAAGATRFFERTLARQPELAERLAASKGIEYTWATAPIAYRVHPHALANALLIGDARGYVSPFYGDGTEIALTQGRDAARRIAEELAGGTSAAEAHRHALARLAFGDKARAEALRIFLHPHLVSAAFRSGMWKRFLERQLA